MGKAPEQQLEAWTAGRPEHDCAGAWEIFWAAQAQHRKDERVKPKILILMVGLPRSGKTTKALELAARHGAAIVNPDAIRLAIHGSAFVPTAEPFVWATAHAMVDALFLAGHPAVVLDACNNTRKRRDEWRYGKWDRREFVSLDMDEKTCIGRVECGDIIPVIKRMAEQHEPVCDEEREPT